VLRLFGQTRHTNVGVSHSEQQGIVIQREKRKGTKVPGPTCIQKGPTSLNIPITNAGELKRLNEVLLGCIAELRRCGLLLQTRVALARLVC